MAKKSLIARNEKRKKLIQNLEGKRKELKKDIKKSENMNEKLKLISSLHKLKRDSSKTRLVPTCAVTGRSKGMIFYKHFGLTRFVLRDFINKGFIPGMIKVN